MTPGPGGRETTATGGTAVAELERLRREIARIDRSLVRGLASRQRLATRAAALKRDAGLPTLDPAREAAVVRAAADLAREEGLSPDVIRAIFWQVIALCRDAQFNAE
jgi:chorismate mutase